ncbi:MAG: class I SAM-dependent methyltransferase, partial [Pseudomonadota bacterium]
YVTRAGREAGVMARPNRADAVPHLRRVPADGLARQIRKTGRVSLSCGGLDFEIALPNGTGTLIAGIDGRRSLAEIAKGAGLDWIVFLQHWGAVSQALSGFNLLQYSRGGRRR